MNSLSPTTQNLKDVGMNLHLRQASRGLLLPLLLMLLLFDSALAVAQFQRTPLGEQTTPTSAPPAPEAEASSDAKQYVQKLAKAFKAAFDAGDAKKVAGFWAPEGEYIQADGKRIVGRKAIEKAYAAFFEKVKKAKIDISVDSVRQIGDKVAIEEGRTMVSVPGSAPDLSQYTATYTNRDGNWEMVSVKESSLASSGSVSALKDLAWLIGTWEAEETGVTLTTDFQWLPGNKFIERTFYSTQSKNKKVIGKQIIGVDPITGDIMSWTFNTDGSHALGIWAPVENGWAIESRGVTSNGMVTSANNILTRLDENGFRWQSVNRTANGQPLSDALEVISRRK